MHTITAQQLRNNPDAAQQAADNAPVLITRAGQPPQVLMRYDEYQRISGEQRTIADVLLSLEHPDVSDSKLDIPPHRRTEKTALEALTPPPELAAALNNIELEIPPRSKAQRRPVDFEE